MSAKAESQSGWQVTLGAGFWGAALLLVLQLHRLPGNHSHVVCGVWGCGPPLQALLAMHGFWLVFLSLPTVLCCRLLSRRRLLAVASTAVLLAVAGVAGVIAWEAEHWLPNVSPLQREYFMHRCVFAVATLVEIPFVQLFLAGIAGVTAVGFKSNSAETTASYIAHAAEAAG